ncbi:bifunctional lysylphosphatidylglycerol flippase/synthetase MprF [Clostridium cavendishii]|nr:DUF2156 domain-containing protein [Clostridium cavendishii]
MFITQGLLRRLRAVWLVNMFLIFLIIIRNFFQNAYFKENIVLLGYILISLLLESTWFKAKTNFIRLKQATIVLAILMIVDVILKVNWGSNFSDMIIYINLSLILIITLLVLRPIVLRSEHHFEERLKVQDLLNRVETNPVSAINLENNRQYFFAQGYDGVIGYVLVNNMAMVVGDPICDFTKMEDILLEFKEYCFNRSLSSCFCQISSKYRNVFEKVGFKLQECGKEAIIDLNTYNISDSIIGFNDKVDKLEIKITEYKPAIKHDKYIEDQIYDISDEWLKMKGSNELSFMRGTISFDYPFEKRYFIAKTIDDKVLGIVVCLPYKFKNGYFIDMVRECKDAPYGIRENLVIEICKILKEEKVKEVSLGLAPFVDIEYKDNTESTFLYKAFKFIYKKMNSIYDFKELYDYKKKYNPSLWESRYIAVSSEISIPSLGYAMMKAKYTKGVKEFFVSILNNNKT